MASLDNGPPRGTRDFLPSAVDRREQVISAIIGTYERFGYRRIETPAIESIERLAGGDGGENEKLIYKILKRGLPEQLADSATVADVVDLGLRFDLTVPLTRFYANHLAELAQPFRSLQIGSVWRAERPAKGRYRQFTQCDIDVIGEPSVLAEAELLEATTTALLGLGIAPVTVRLGDRRLLSAVAAEAGVPPEASRGLFIALDKLDKIGWDGVLAELDGRGLPVDAAERVRHLVEILSSAGAPDELLRRAADLFPALDPSVLGELARTAGALDALHAADERVSFVLDATIVRGMGYYTGQIFEVSHAGSDSSIAGGGRYDGLVGRSLGSEVPACGISIGFDRIVDLATVAPVELGIAFLCDEDAGEAVLAAARSLHAEGVPVALRRRRKALRQQLDSLRDEGYSAFVLYEPGREPEVRRFDAPGGRGAER